MSNQVDLTPELIHETFKNLGNLAFQQGRVVDLAVYGGSALAIAYDLRMATKDVDAVFEKDKDFVRNSALEIANQLALPENWLNDAVKGFISGNESMIHFASYPSQHKTGLRVFVPAPNYFFAMKCIGIRIGENSHDVADVKNLIKICEIKNIDQAYDIIDSYYPRSMIRTKAQFALEEIFSQPDVTNTDGFKYGRDGFKDKVENFRRDSQNKNSLSPKKPI